MFWGARGLVYSLRPVNLLTDRTSANARKFDLSYALLKWVKGRLEFSFLICFHPGFQEKRANPWAGLLSHRNEHLSRKRQVLIISVQSGTIYSRPIHLRSLVGLVRR